MPKGLRLIEALCPQVSRYAEETRTQEWREHLFPSLEAAMKSAVTEMRVYPDEKYERQQQYEEYIGKTMAGWFYMDGIPEIPNVLRKNK